MHGRFERTLIAKQTAHGAPVYRSEQNPHALRARVEAFHEPYHRALRALLDEKLSRFGRVLLLDLHSFMGPIFNDVCIGDVHGTSSCAFTCQAFEDAFRREELDVVRNEPFSGGYIVRAYADPPRVETLQLELRYTNYVDCAHIDERPPRFDLGRIAAAQAWLRPALDHAIAAFTSSRS